MRLSPGAGSSAAASRAGVAASSGSRAGRPRDTVKKNVLPVPTSLLVDASGKVRWMDQSENYQRRSDPEKVLAALNRHLADSAAS